MRAAVEPGDLVTLNYFLMMSGIPIANLAGNTQWAAGPFTVDNRTGTVQGPELAPLTAQFTGVPREHDGSNAFELTLAFSEEPHMSYRTIGEKLLTVSGGSLTRALPSLASSGQQG